MKKIIKYATISIIGFLFLLTVTVILLPVFINEQKYVPVIEQKISDLTGRSFSVGDDLNIAYFPWLSISFSNLKLGNPEGFSTDEFLSVGSLEAQVELLPLLFGQIHVRRFVVGGLEVNMERRSDGSENWLFNTISDQTLPLQVQSDAGWGVLPGNMNIALFAVTDAKITIKDLIRQTEYKVDDIMLLATDISPDKPVATEIKALIDGKRVAMKGNIGPFGRKSGIDPVPVDMRLVVANVLKTSIRGGLSNLYSSPSYDLNVQVESFSPRYLCNILDIGFPMAVINPETYDSLSLDMMVKGSKSEIRVEQGDARLDNTQIKFSFTAKNFDHPDVTLDVDLDSIDLAHYVTPGTEELSGSIADDTPCRLKTCDYTTWENLSITANLFLKTLTFNGGSIHDIRARLNGEDGIFTIAPSSFSINKGKIQSTATINLQKKVPEVTVSVKLKNLQLGHIPSDPGDKDIITGTLDGEMRAYFSGLDCDSIRKTLNGKGAFVLQNGVLHGIDLQDKVTDKSSIEYSRINSVFSIKDGVFSFQETSLLTPSGEMLVSGDVNFVTDKINFTMEPSKVNVDKGSENSNDHLQNLTSFVVTGTLSSPCVVVSQNPSVEITQSFDKAVVQKLVDEKIPSPVGEDVKGLVGKALIDPEIVARRFGLQPVKLRSLKKKNVFPVGSGKIEIGQLLEEDIFRDLQGGMN